MTNTTSYAEVLKVAGVRPFLRMQFLTAFNDNEYKLVTFFAGRALVTTNQASSGTCLSLAGFIFI